MDNGAIDLMLRHRSIRRFSDEAVGDDVLRELVECGLRASYFTLITRYFETLQNLLGSVMRSTYSPRWSFCKV